MKTAATAATTATGLSNMEVNMSMYRITVAGEFGGITNAASDDVAIARAFAIAKARGFNPRVSGSSPNATVVEVELTDAEAQAVGPADASRWMRVY